jgi:hydrogenase maturation protease
MHKTTLLLGLGNILLGDEGFGVHVARMLKETTLPDYVRVEEGGVGGFNLLGYLDGVERVVIIDVMMQDFPPGKLRWLTSEADLAEPGKIALSFHQVGPLDLVKMFGLLGYEPQLYYLVARPQTMEWSMELSPPLKKAALRSARILEKLSWENFKGLERSRSVCIS